MRLFFSSYTDRFGLLLLIIMNWYTKVTYAVKAKSAWYGKRKSVSFPK